MKHLKPTYQLLHYFNQTGKSSDNEITDPMKIAISKALMGLEKEII